MRRPRGNFSATSPSEPTTAPMAPGKMTLMTRDQQVSGTDKNLSASVLLLLRKTADSEVENQCENMCVFLPDLPTNA